MNYYGVVFWVVSFVFLSLCIVGSCRSEHVSIIGENAEKDEDVNYLDEFCVDAGHKETTDVDKKPSIGSSKEVTWANVVKGNVSNVHSFETIPL